MVHLFDLCLRFGLMDTAWALALRGVEGCILEGRHLGPFGTGSGSSERPCYCQGWDTCHYCCWAFPVEQGTWMEDWDVNLIGYQQGLVGAIPAAEKAAATPLTRAMLDICTRDMELPFSGSAKAMARLLDIAILTGNQKAAVNLSDKCQLRPLRRWALDWDSEACCWEAARTALWAGAGFQDLMVKYPYWSDVVPFPKALFLKSKLEDWQEIRHLLPHCHGLWRPRSLENHLGHQFLQHPHGPSVGLKLSLGKIRAAEDAGLDLRFLCVGVVCRDGPMLISDRVTLLDMAIWCGQPDCAEACVHRGIELKDDDRYDSLATPLHNRVLRGASVGLFGPLKAPICVVPSEAETATEAAGHASLKRSWKSESSQKGIALYQMMLKMLKGRSFPMVLVQEILTFSMPVPKIIDQLDLWERVGDWMTTICSRPTFVHAAADCNTADVEEPEGMQHNGEAEDNGKADDNGEAGALLHIEVLVLVSFVRFQGKIAAVIIPIIISGVINW